jgi:hypothetical protein
MRCLFCGNKLGYLRKLAGKQFCSDECEKAHAQQQDAVALARLMEVRFAEPEPVEEPAIPEAAGAAGVEPEPQAEPAPQPAGFLREWLAGCGMSAATPLLEVSVAESTAWQETALRLPGAAGRGAVPPRALAPDTVAVAAGPLAPGIRFFGGEVQLLPPAYALATEIALAASQALRIPAPGRLRTAGLFELTGEASAGRAAAVREPGETPRGFSSAGLAIRFSWNGRRKPVAFEVPPPASEAVSQPSRSGVRTRIPGSGRRLVLPESPRITAAPVAAPSGNGSRSSESPSRTRRKPVLELGHHLPAPDLSGASFVPPGIAARDSAARSAKPAGTPRFPVAHRILDLAGGASRSPAPALRIAPPAGALETLAKPRPSALVNTPSRVRGFTPAAGLLRRSLPGRSVPAGFNGTMPVALRARAADHPVAYLARPWLRFSPPAPCRPDRPVALAAVAGLAQAGPVRSRPRAPCGSAAAPFAEISALDFTTEPEPAGGLGAIEPERSAPGAFPPTGESAKRGARIAPQISKTRGPLVLPAKVLEIDSRPPGEPEQTPGEPEIQVFTPPPRRGAFSFVAIRWKRLPGLARKTVLAVSALAVLVLVIPRFEAPDASPVASLQAAVSKRASLEIEDDFRAGLSRWKGGRDWARDWQYDLAGFLRPGRQLALLTESLPLSDYRLEFLAQIEHKAITWVFRAADLKNYYCYKIVILKPGPLPTAGIVRYAVVDGRQSDRTQLPLPLNIRNDTIYQVRTDVRGNQFTTYVNGQLMDTWTHTRFPTGGVGFLCERGESVRLRWVRLTDRDDVIGKLCSYVSGKN